MSDPTLRDAVQERYAEAARQIEARSAGAGGEAAAECCGSGDGVRPGGLDLDQLTPEGVFGVSLYGSADAADGAEPALEGSLGCGVPTAVADLHEGETVLDLGSGTGGDVLISARRVGPTGRAIGLDMTPQMLELARRNADEAGVGNVEFVQGYLEEVEQWSGCIAGALVEEDYRRMLGEAGFEDIEIQRTHEVHELASAAVVRARRPEVAS